METIFKLVLCPLYVAFVVAIPVTAVRFPVVFGIVALPLQRVALYLATTVGLLVIGGGYIGIDMIGVIIEIDPQAAHAALDATRPAIYRAQIVLGALVLVWIVTVCSRILRNQIDKHMRVIACENGGRNESEGGADA